MSQLKAELRVFGIGVRLMGLMSGLGQRGADLVPADERARPQLTVDLREILVFEIIDFAAQPVEFFIEREHGEAAEPARQHVEASVGITLENRLHDHCTACTNDSSILCKYDAELAPVSFAIAHHCFVALFEDMQRHHGTGECDKGQREQREQPGHAAIISDAIIGTKLSTLGGKVFIVTGASDGIGARLAAELRHRGARLVLNARDEKKLRAIAGPDDLIVAGDLTEDAVRVAIVERTIERFATLDGLINNAGRGSYYPPSLAPLNDARSLFELNFFAPLHLAQLATPWLRRTRGSLVNIGSIASQISLPWLPVYSASKFALASISTTQRIELRRHGVHVMSVFPGYVDTAFQTHAAGAAPPNEIVKGRRFAVTPEECAQAVIRGLERRSNTVVTPRVGWLLIWLNRLAPWLVESRLNLI